MIPSTTVTGFGFTGSDVQTTTAATAVAVPTASHYGSVALHSGPNLLQGQECPLPLQCPPVLKRSFKALATDSSLQKLPAGDQSRLTEKIGQIQNKTAHLFYEETASLWHKNSLLEDQVKNLTNKNKLLNSEVAARQKENAKLKKENERAKCQLEESKKKEITAKVDIKNLQQELRDQKKLLEEKLESIAKFKTYIASAIGCPARYQEAISFEDLIKKVSALKEELHSLEVKFSSLSAEYQVVKNSERNLYAENLKKEKELKNLRHLPEDAEETLRRNRQSLKDRVSTVNVNHGYAKRQKLCATVSQSVTTNETEREAVDTLLLLSGQSPSDVTPELTGLLQKKETAG
ncbi:hypothetical protein NX722_24400 [Endozoicomonas gorgoniicola]|uniref:DUF4200 domain-containing protein n=1 Tax=Endozoicomonas gorgoniicola TaxID=1234144 RepID=A0ABT3N273_9GAMM|nr:hypothetical protein [Endozoicomonas gorgoniicola]MCW7555711.1 hypothetical protein [Endozoicomonas gorgoniicola]